jgi:hypothetical protein
MRCDPTVYLPGVGNYQRLLNDPDLAAERRRQDVVVGAAREMADTLTFRQRAVVLSLADTFERLRADHDEAVEDGLEQAVIVARLSTVVDVAAGYISTLPHHSHRSPDETRQWLEDAARG